MSRKQTLAAQQKALVEQAIYQKQCPIWMRSLQRNDADMAAVLDLNRSLYAVKQTFLLQKQQSTPTNSNNELLLLKIGQGMYRLSPDGSDHLVKPVLVTVATSTSSSPSKSSSPNKGSTGSPTKDSTTPVVVNATANPGSISSPAAKEGSTTTTTTILQYQSVPYDEISAEQQELMVDFLLRKKLRRKLISRILRRLQRIATSMDHLEQMTIPSSGNAAAAAMAVTDIVAPSGPPKYGDLRLYCDPMAVNEFAHLQRRQFTAMQHMIAAREQEGYDNDNHHDNSGGGGLGLGLVVPLLSPISSPKRHGNKNSMNPTTTITTNTSDTVPPPEPYENVPAVVEDEPVVDTLVQPVEKREDETSDVVEATPSQPKTNDAHEAQAIKVEAPAPGDENGDDDVGTRKDEEIVTPAMSSSNGTDQQMTKKSGDTVEKQALLPVVPSSSTDVLTAKDSIPSSSHPIGYSMVEDHHQSDPIAVNYELFKDYKDAYEKEISSVIPIDDGSTLPDNNDNIVPFLQTFLPDRMDVNYTILQDTQREEDYMIIRNGIGATHPNMSLQEREAEYQKWQSNLLSRIPEQPTYADLGLENRVFLLEERLKRAMEQQQEEHAVVKEQTSLAQAEESNEDGMDIDKKEEMNEQQEQKEENTTLKIKIDNDDADFEKELDKSNDDIKNETEDAEMIDIKIDDKAMIAADGDDDIVATTKNDDEAKVDDVGDNKVVVEPKILRPISLVAIPSFYEQDLKRIKLVQAELMSSSMREHAIQRLEDVTREFNQSLKNSMELANHRTYIQNQVNTLLPQIRALTQSVQSDYMVQVALARNRWNLDRCSFETHKLNRLLPSRNGILPTGTTMTQSYKTQPDRFVVGLNEVVATCIADIVDCVDYIGNGHGSNERFQEPFVPPTPSADVEALQRAKQLETAKRNDLSTYTLKLRTSEGERLRAWRKMLKTKMEFDIPHQHHSSSGQIRVLRLDMNMCTSIPLPGLHQTAAQNVPQEMPGRSSVATYTPMHTIRSQPSHAVNMSESKYSTARVRERIASDGTVAPVTKPKMTADGLYLRPAGRTRKGMEWDAVRGIWIPASEAVSMQY